MNDINTLPKTTFSGRRFTRKQFRKRVINSMLIILLIFQLVCSKNSQSYDTTIDELWDSCDRLNLSLPRNGSIALSSFCAARIKLDEAAFKQVNQRIIATYAQQYPKNNTYKWLGHGFFAVDGSKINLPRTLLSSNYKLPSKNANYPQGLLSCLYQVKSQVPFDFDLVSHANERICAQHYLHTLQENDVVVYDRGYFSYVMLHQHFDSKIHHAVFRLQKNSYTVVRDFFSSRDTDIIATIYPSSQKRREIMLKHPNLEIVPTLKVQMHTIKTNFKNCIHVFSRSLEELLLLQTKMTTAVKPAYHLIIGRNQKERPGRSYARKSMKPESKWHPSKEKKRKRKFQRRRQCLYHCNSLNEWL